MRLTQVDAILQSHTPVVMVPLHGEFIALATVGHRFLAASDGLWLEVRRPWLHLIWPVATQDRVPMPYGTVQRKVELAFERLPMDVADAFVADALSAYPNEVGGVVLWDERTGDVSYRRAETLQSGVGNLRARWPELEPGQSVVVDLHSHGQFPPFFSETDRADTGSEVVIAGVLGRVGSEQPEWKFALFACGLEISVASPVCVTHGS